MSAVSIIFPQSYGGLRGAVAFCLAMLIRDDDTPSIDGKPSSSEFKRTIVTTTISVVIFTCFIQVFFNFFRSQI